MALPKNDDNVLLACLTLLSALVADGSKFVLDQISQQQALLSRLASRASAHPSKLHDQISSLAKNLLQLVDVQPISILHAPDAHLPMQDLEALMPSSAGKTADLFSLSPAHPLPDAKHSSTTMAKRIDFPSGDIVSSSTANPYASCSPAHVRLLCRQGLITGGTSGMSAGYGQANLVVLPKSLAYDFLVFCQRNPKPCPLIDVTDPGSHVPQLLCGSETPANICSDLPKYRIYRDGVLEEERHDVTELWDQYHRNPKGQADPLVGFLLGCSYGFEDALRDAGLPLRHQEESKIVPMYRTSLQCKPAGVFSGPMVVSMRPMTMQQAIKAVEVTSHFTGQHGPPVHIGDPKAIGIKDINKPDFGESVSIRADEVPVFWPCGVTPQSVAMASKPSFMISHAPGCMLVCDVRSSCL